MSCNYFNMDYLSRGVSKCLSMFVLSAVLIISSTSISKATCVPTAPCVGYLLDVELTQGRTLAQNSFDIANNALNNNVANAIHMSHCGSNSCSINTLEHVDTDSDVTFDEMALWLRDEFWYGNSDASKSMAPALRDMATQITTMGMAQIGIIGTFFDAESHNNGQRLINLLHAEAQNDYQPSRSLCRFGTIVRSLAATEELSRATKLLLTKRSIDRQMGNSFSIAAAGEAQDKASRMANFQNVYCDYTDNNGLLAPICETGITSTRINKDINFSKTLYSPMTLDIDFNTNAVTPDEMDVLALANNLYAHNVFVRIDKSALTYESNREVFLDARSIMAKRSVAENSYNNLVAMKTKGSNEASTYMKKILNELGITTESEINELLSDNPSYYAQMEVLTKKLYQNPNFYIGLIDKPANVSRQQAAMQAFELMQQRDLYESTLRSEAILSVLVETRLIDMNNEAEDELLGIK